MFDLAWRDRKRASWIRKQTKVKDILITITKLVMGRTCHAPKKYYIDY